MTRAVIVALVLFVWAPRVHAATVDITVSLSPGTTTWYLEVNSLQPVGAISLLVPSAFESFTQLLPPPVDPPICALYLGGCAPLPPNAPPGFQAFVFVYGQAPGGLLLPFSGLIGAFSSQVTSGVEILPFENIAYDTQGNALDYSIHVVPEPGVSGLSFLGALAVSLLHVRRVRVRFARSSSRPQRF